MERVQRWREPAVVVVTAVLVARLAVTGAFALSSARLGLSSVADAAFLASRQLSDPVPFAVLAVLVLACHAGPVTRHARLLAALALGVAGASLVLMVVLALTGFVAYTPPFSQLDLLDRFVAMVVPAVAVALLVVLVRRGPGAAVTTTGDAVGTGTPAPAEVAVRPDPALQPTWEPDAAAGAVWTTAGEAASGRPASSWGSPDRGGWTGEAPRSASESEETGSDQGDHEPEADGGHHWSRPHP